MKKSKLFLSIVSLCFALAVLAFGVFAANQVNYTISGNICYEVSDVYVDVTTSVYRAKQYMSRLDVRNAIDDASAEATNENPTPLATTITSNANFALVNGVSDHFDTLNAQENVPYTLEDLELEFSTESGSEAYAYFFIINVKKLSTDVPNVWVAIADTINEIENTYIYDNMYVDVTNSTTGSDLIVALALDDVTAEIDTLDEFTFGVKMGIGDISQSDWMLNKLEFTLNDEDENNVYYEVSSSSDEIAGLVVIPSTHNGKPVTAISEDDGIGSDNIREIYLPDCITSLGMVTATYLNNINLQDYAGTTILDGSLTDSDLVKIVFPDCVTTLDGDCFLFQENVYLQYLQLSSNLEILSENCFQVCKDSLEVIRVNGDENNSVFYSSGNCLLEKDNGEVIFRLGCKNSVIPDEVTQMCDRCLTWCTQIRAITIPENVNSINRNGLEGCTGLESIIVDEDNDIYDSRDNCNAIITTSSDTLIYGCKNTSIPLSIDTIGAGAFHSSSITSIVIPNNITTIGTGAFYGCNLLTNITLPNNISVLKSQVFESCSNLTSIEIPSSVTSIEDGAFEYCRSLSTIQIPSSIISIGSNVFWNTAWYNNNNNALKILTASDDNSVKFLVDSDDSKINATITASDLANVKVIAGGTFRMSNVLSSITIPQSVISIGSYAFAHCSNFSTINYTGTKTQWSAIIKGNDLNTYTSATVVHCSDGDVAI